MSKQNYTVVKSFLHRDLCKIAEQYCLFQMLNNFSPDTENGQVPGTHSVYSDSLMESLLLYAKPNMEEVVGLKLIPTYSYYRVYRPGDILKEHTDRFACQISATITLGYKYNNSGDDYKWRLYGYVNNEKKYIDSDVGDAIVYKGCDLVHGRDVFDADKDSYHVQVFLHYVNAEEPNIDQYVYDGRPGIGYIKK